MINKYTILILLLISLLCFSKLHADSTSNFENLSQKTENEVDGSSSDFAWAASSGNDTIYICYGIYSNDATVCSAHGTCIANDTCLCMDTHTGLQCESKKPITPATPASDSSLWVLVSILVPIGAVFVLLILICLCILILAIMICLGVVLIVGGVIFVTIMLVMKGRIRIPMLERFKLYQMIANRGRAQLQKTMPYAPNTSDGQNAEEPDSSKDS